MSRTVTLTVDGETVTVPAGRTVAAALTLEKGRPGWRTTRRVEGRRGLFCGIGACFDCLATVDGRPGLRTCMVPVADGMEVCTSGGPQAEDVAPAAEADGTPSEEDAR